MSNSEYLDSALSEQLINTGVLKHDDEKCFWTDTYCATKQEIEECILGASNHVIIVGKDECYSIKKLCDCKKKSANIQNRFTMGVRAKSRNGEWGYNHSDWALT